MIVYPKNASKWLKVYLFLSRSISKDTNEIIKNECIDELKKVKVKLKDKNKWLQSKSDDDKEAWFNAVTELEDEFQVIKVYNEKTSLITANIYQGVLYLNEKKKQIVLAHNNMVADLKSFFSADGQLISIMDGVVQNKTVAQLYTCYQVTKQAVEEARSRDCYLSFTGFSNGAWLAEHSVYFAHTELENEKTRGVLFESPGIVKSEIDIHSNEIINKKQEDFSLSDLNIVNYLTAPSFSNACNQHIGLNYRIFPDAIKFRANNKMHEDLKTLKEKPILGKLYEWVLENKSGQFFLDGILSMFYPGKLGVILAEFDAAKGKPKYCEEVDKWPMIKFDLSKDYEENLKNLTKTMANKPIGLIPLPSFMKDFAGGLLSWVVGKVADKCVQKMAPGLHMLVNLLIELQKGNIDLDQFENPSYYESKFRLKEEVNNNKNDIDLFSSTPTEKKDEQEDKKKKKEKEKEDKKRKEEVESKNKKEFDIFNKNMYKTSEYTPNKRKLRVNVNNLNNDWCLDYLREKYEQHALGREYLPKQSDIVFTLLSELPTLYSVKSRNNDDKTMTKEIMSDKFDVERIEERLIRICLLDDDHLKVS